MFRVNVIESEDLIKTIDDIKAHGYKVISTTLESSKTIYDFSYEKTAIIVGNEANGITKKVINASDAKAKIPMKGRTESLNAAVAASVVLYEAMRQLG
ncbi:MAG: RNA methyltransferase [Clostridia bacterium]|nr:RNA methyltransferase [Clostridia bacterium]